MEMDVIAFAELNLDGIALMEILLILKSAMSFVGMAEILELMSAMMEIESILMGVTNTVSKSNKAHRL